MDEKVRALVDMGATSVQARAALRKFSDVETAAEQIFDGRFDHVKDDDEEMRDAEKEVGKRATTPDEDEDGDGEEDEEDEGSGVDDYVDYDSDYEAKAVAGKDAGVHGDPYAGIFFSKDRKEEVIEVEEEPELVFIPGNVDPIPLMTQSEWMKGCPEGGEQGFLFQLYNGLSAGSCACPSQCGASRERSKKDFFAIHSSFTAYTTALRETVQQTCSKCRQVYCLACGESVSTTPTQQRSFPGASGTANALFHCANLQGIILGIGLHMIEQLFQEQHRAHDDTVGGSKKRKVSPQAGSYDDDDEYMSGEMVRGKKAKAGTGYAGMGKEDNTGHLEAMQTQKARDSKMAALMVEVREFLPSLQRKGGVQTSDYLVHPSALAHLRRRFNWIGSTLLRNDSLTDMSDRSVLYFELFSWLETISNHEALASMMAMPIMVVASIKPKAPIAGSGSRPAQRERIIMYEGSSGPRELLESIVIQAQAAIKGLEGMKPVDTEHPEGEMTESEKRMTVSEKGKQKELSDAVPDENLNLLRFCQRILSTTAGIDRSLRETKGDDFVNRLHASLPKAAGSGPAPSLENQPEIVPGETDEETIQIYESWGNKCRFEYCDLSIPAPAPKEGDNTPSAPSYKFYFNNDARMLANADIPKRSLAIAKELAVLTTNLPVAWGSSVFLRVDESRVDVIKALITGPEGTPYYNGCFLFDIFLGASYNNSPPSVKYMTTNGGRFRFNPNLYADGKVCLSLLGTWSGPGWVSGKSTLLQVLISIQSMILCDEPYLNEPGWSSGGGTPASKAYSANVRRMVVHTAMLGNLKAPPEPFADVITTHFRLKARSLFKQLDEWLELDDGRVLDGQNGGGQPNSTGTGASQALRRDVQELKSLLLKLDPNAASGNTVNSD
ncbi:ubiquitin conjugating enzyme family protein [Rhizoctonia solani AG-3 Rhs1AP]|uniref:Ubiquitin conjugating enzyme family protein n=1 Tax=Rhizoctonia solani AG-3 Rhs1AP TaxID=1086054 RepID=X8JNE5_9AGAM|nr:ubiquitin conjugating enzyme family protein [Rhizoctonia solani AG-3 Rhs1AP]